MGSEHTLNPNGGVLFRRGLEEPTQVFTTRLRPGNLDETPRADPHAGCCGVWGRKTPGYPIGSLTFLLYEFLQRIVINPKLYLQFPCEKSICFHDYCPYFSTRNNQDQKPVGFLKFLSRKLPSILFAISTNRFEGTENDTISSGIKFLTNTSLSPITLLGFS